MASILRETAAIVVDSLDHGESDKIVTFYTRDHGKITGIAKGANRSKKRFLNKLELFSYLTISYSEKPYSSLAFIADAELHNSFINLRSNIDYYISATFIRETLLIATTQRERDLELFPLLLWTLQSIDEDRPHLTIVAIFLLRLIQHMGYRPDLSTCRFCSTPFSLEQSYKFHHLSGGLICERCLGGEKASCSEMATGTIRIIDSALTEPLARLHRLSFSKQAQRQTLTMLHRYARNLFQREIQSWKALRKLLR